MSRNDKIKKKWTWKRQMEKKAHMEKKRYRTVFRHQKLSPEYKTEMENRETGEQEQMRTE